MKTDNTIKLHFASSKNAIAHSVDGSCTAGMRTASGRITTWIAHVVKATPQETLDDAAKRVRDIINNNQGVSKS